MKFLHNKLILSSLLATIFTCSLLVNPSIANAELPKDAVNVEALGNGLFYSVNYERVIADKVGLRAGYSYMGADVGSFPFSVSYLGIRSQSEEHILELAGGVTLFMYGYDLNPVTMNVGYRFQKDKLQFRAGTMYLPTGGFVDFFGLWPYLSIGSGF